MAQPTVYDALVATLSVDRTQRDGAFVFLKNLEETNASYRELLARELFDETKPVQMRQVAGTVLKNTLFSKDEAVFAKQTENYAQVPVAIRQNVKSCTLQSLLSPHRDVRLAAASAACHVAIAEMSINRDGWDEFFHGLVHLASQTQNEESCGRAESALKCIGYFAERAEELAVKVDVPKTNMILTSVVGALVGQPDGVRFAALSAMNHMLPFAKNNFATEAERNFIIQRLHDCALPGIQTQGPDGSVVAFQNSPNIRERALECCTRIIELYYDKIDHTYVVAVYNITVTALDLKTNTAEEVMLQAINFWSTLAQVESHYEEAAVEGDTSSCVSRKLAIAAAGVLLPQLLACIQGEGRDYRETDPDAEDDSYSPYTAAAECLKFFAGLMKGDVLPYVTPFLGNLKSKDWKCREAALFAFAQIMEGPEESTDPAKDVASLIAQCLPAGICPLLQDESSHAVRHSAAYALGRAVKFFPHAVLRVYENPDKFYLSTVQLLDPSRLSAKDPRTVEFYLWSLKEMVSAVHEKYPNQHILPGSEIIFQALLATVDRPDSNQSELRALSFEVMCDFILCCSDAMMPYIMHSLLNDMMTRLFNALSVPQSSASDATARSVIIAKLISCIGSVFMRFSMSPAATAELAVHLKKIMPNGVSFADNVANCFVQALPSDAELAGGNMCAEEVVLAAAQMSKIVTSDFQKYLEVLNPRMLTFMQSIHAGDLSYITCTSIGDIVRSLGPQIPQFPAQVLLHWIHICGQLVGSDTDSNYGVTTWNSVKSIALTLIGDIVIELGASINDQYRQQIMIALDAAHQQIQMRCGQLSPQLDDDDVTYAEMLISDTLYLWSHVAQAHKQMQDVQSGAGQVFATCIPQIIQCMSFAVGFSQWLGTDDRGDPAPLLCSCANLVVDSVKCLGPAVADHLRSTPVVIELLSRLGKISDQNSTDTLKLCNSTLNGGR